MKTGFVFCVRKYLLGGRECSGEVLERGGGEVRPAHCSRPGWWVDSEGAEKITKKKEAGFPAPFNDTLIGGFKLALHD